VMEVPTAMLLWVDVYSSAVFTRLAGFDFAPTEALMLALPLIALSALLWTAERALPVNRVEAVARPGVHAVRLFDRRRDTCIAMGIAVLASGMGLAPILITALELTHHSVDDAAGYFGNGIQWSVLYAASTATLATVIAIALVSAIREQPRIVRALEALTWMGFLLPPALLALGAIAFRQTPIVGSMFSGAMLVVLALLARYIVVAMRVLRIGELHLAASSIEASRSSGCGYWRRIWRVHLPGTMRFAAIAWILVFVFCVRDTETVALLYPAGGAPLSVRMFTLEANGPPGALAAISLALQALVAVPLIGAAVLLRTRP
jgi:iron(III) transport system permease protein